MSTFTAEQEAYFDSINEGRLSGLVAEMMNEKFGTKLTSKQIAAYRKDHHKPCGVTCHWGNGQKRADNHGKHLSPGTEFKKGSTPHNTLPIGTQVECDGYIWVKVRDERCRGIAAKKVNWVQLHRKVWEDANGPIPAGGVILFKDGDTRNCDLDNLMLATREEAQYIQRKHLLKAGPEYADTASLIAKIYRATKR